MSDYSTIINNRMTITVALITRNRQNYLKRCLNSLVNQTKNPLEVIVVDNGSKDQTKRVVNTFKDKLPLRYTYEKKIGIPYARNRALEEARGKILAFLDDDCEADKHWLEEMLKAHRNYPDIAAVQGQSLAIPKGSLVSILSQTYHHQWLLSNMSSNNLLRVIDTKNISFKINKLRKNKLYFDLWYKRGSDVDLARQLILHKEKIFFYSKAKIYFRARSDIISFLKQRFEIGRAHTRLAIKWSLTKLPYSHPFELKKSNRIKNFLNLLSQARINKWPELLFINFLEKFVFRFGKTIEKSQALYDLLGYSDQNISKKNKNLNFPTVTVLINTRNRSSFLRKCLSSLTKQTIKPTKILIVDNNSSDETKAVASSFKQLPILYINEKKIGLPHARNTGLKYVKSKIVAFLDDDCEADKHWLEEMLTWHVNNPLAGGIQGRSISNPRNNKYAILSQFLRDIWYGESITFDNKLSIADTKNLSVKAHLIKIKKYNLRFRDELFIAGGEDIDFGRQIIAIGKSIFYNCAAVVYHSEPQTFLEFLIPRYQKGYGYSILKNLWRNYPYLDIGLYTNKKLMMLFHPWLKLKSLQILEIIFLYFIQKAAFRLGAWRGKKFLEKLSFKKQY